MRLTMWFETQNCAMMGVQATAGKRKLETAATAGDSCPVKAGRWEPPASEDCIARLQAVAVPGDAWRPTPAPTPAPPLISSTLLADDFDDDDDFEDELSDDDRCSGAPEPLRYGQPTTYQARYQPPQHQSGGVATSPEEYGGGGARAGPPYWQYYTPPPAQQTIRCDENGKSYLELGSAPVSRARCCDGRTRLCNVPCYRQRRLAVLNLSMCKLARYRQCSDPSLRRSVLICNTLRHIEREMEMEGVQHHPHQQQSPPSPHPHHLPHHPHQQQQVATSGEPCYPQSPFQTATAVPVPNDPTLACVAQHYEHSLREFSPSSGRVTPFPPPPDTDSGLGDEDSSRGINWGSVLSLTSQTDLEPLNNNELYAELGLAAAAPELTEWKEAARPDGEWDSFMHVLVGGT